MKEPVGHDIKAVQMTPDFTEAHYILGDILIRQGKVRQGISNLTQALRMMPDQAKACFFWEWPNNGLDIENWPRKNA